jgi:hypothetical protein
VSGIIWVLTGVYRLKKVEFQENEDYDFTFDLEERYSRPWEELKHIISRKRFLELKERFKREPWGSKSINRSLWHIIEMLRRVCRANGVENMSVDDIEPMNPSNTIEYRDDICDLLNHVDAKPWDIAPGSSRAIMTQLAAARIEDKLK